MKDVLMSRADDYLGELPLVSKSEMKTLFFLPLSAS